MTRNYNRGKVYKIFNDVDDMIYVGSTTKEFLSQRMAEHRYTYARKRCKKIKVYSHMIKLGIEHFNIVLLESYPCKSRDELCAREQFWKEKLNPKLNTRACFIPPEKRKDVNTAQTKKSKQRPEYKAKRNQKLKCLCGGKTTHQHRAQHLKSKRHTVWAIDNKQFNTYEKCFTERE